MLFVDIFHNHGMNPKYPKQLRSFLQIPHVMITSLFCILSMAVLIQCLHVNYKFCESNISKVRMLL